MKRIIVSAEIVNDHGPKWLLTFECSHTKLIRAGKNTPHIIPGETMMQCKACKPAEKQFNVKGFDFIEHSTKPVWLVYLTCGHTKHVSSDRVENIKLKLVTRCPQCEKQNRKAQSQLNVKRA